MIDLEKLCIKIATTEDGDDVKAILENYSLWNDKSCWKAVGSKGDDDKNLNNFSKDCEKGFPIVISDCVSYKHSHVEEYAEIAKKFGYRSYVVNSEPISLSSSKKLNSHNVPDEKLKLFYRNWEPWPSSEKMRELIFK